MHHQFFILLLLTFLSQSTTQIHHKQPKQCNPDDYTTAAKAHQTTIQLAGFTRSTSKQSSFTLLTPEARVYSSPPPGWQGKLSAAAVITPALGAHFSMYLLESSNAQLPNPVTFPSASPKLERFLYVLSGTIQIISHTNSTVLTPGAFVYFSPGDHIHSVVAATASLIQIDRVYAGSANPLSVIGHELNIQTELVPGEVFRLRRLLNPNDTSIDFNIHIMDFSPGQYLNIKELHYNQHGLFMLQGHGIYRLDDTFLPVATGDVIYLAPFVPQWYAALGSTPTRYFLYKDVNLDPLHT